jgi:Na+/phosphate symporter
MALVCPDIGEVILLQYIVGKVAAGNTVLHLYTGPLNADVSISDSTIVGNLVELTSAGYAPITLTSVNWTTTQVGGVSTAVYSEVTFNLATTATTYGYYVTNVTGDLLWLERFSGAPFNIPSGGGTVSISTKLTLS